MIGAFLTRIWARTWPYIATAAGIIAGLFYVRQSGKQAGRAEVERQQADATSEQRRRVNAVDTKLSEMDNDDVRNRLRDWVRSDEADRN